MMNLENVRIINYKNENFELGPEDNAETVLQELGIDRNTMEFYQEGETLYISQKAGTKGAGIFMFGAETGEVDHDEVAEGLKARFGEGKKSVRYRQLENGEFVPIFRELEDEEVDRLMELGVTIPNELTEEDLKEMKEMLLADKATKLAEMLNKTTDEAVEIVKEIRKLLFEVK